MQVPETPNLTLYYDIPSDNYDEYIVSKGYDSDQYGNVLTKKIVVDNSVWETFSYDKWGHFVPQYTFATAGLHKVEVFFFPYSEHAAKTSSLGAVGIYDEDDGCSYPSTLTKIVANSPEDFLQLSYCSSGDRCYYEGTVNEFETALNSYLNTLPDHLKKSYSQTLNYVANPIHCIDGDYNVQRIQ